jgi:anaerobic selenocysteine-containing dehydrogenase
MEVCPEASVLLHWEDARELGLAAGDPARVVSSRGEVVAPVQTRPRGPRGVVQVPPHFPAQPLNRLVGWDDRVVRVRVEKA